MSVPVVRSVLGPHHPDALTGAVRACPNQMPGQGQEGSGQEEG